MMNTEDTYTILLGKEEFLLPKGLLKYFETLHNMLVDVGSTEEKVSIPVPDFVTKPWMRWITEVLGYYDEYGKDVKVFEDLYTLRPGYTSELVIFHANPPSLGDLPLLSSLIKILNWLGVHELLILTLDKTYELIETLTTKQLLEKTSLDVEDGVGLPLTPYYKRLRLIQEYMSLYMTRDLVRAIPAALQKRIDPMACGWGEHELFITKDKELYDTPFLDLYSGFTVKEKEEGLVIPQKIELNGEKPLLVSCGRSHSLCLTDSGRVWSANDNSNGQLGNGKSGSSDEWQPVKGLEGDVLLLAAGYDCSIVVTSIGMFVTGSNKEGHIGLGEDSLRNFTEFVRVKNVSGRVLRVFTGYSSTVILTTTGLYGVGSNRVGQLGTATYATAYDLSPFKDVEGTILDLSASGSHTMIITSSGNLYACGFNIEGQLGLPGTPDTPQEHRTPRGVRFFTQVKHFEGKPLRVWCGDSTSFLLTTKGLYACGDNDSGELGIGSISGMIKKFTPVSTRHIKGEVQSLVAARNRTFLLTSHGLYQTGKNQRLFEKNTKFDFLVFTQIDFDLGYTFGPQNSTKLLDHILSCEGCCGEALFITQQERMLVCSKYCLIKK